VFGYAWDARPPGGDLRALLTRGPERGVHVIGWWRTVGRLRDDLGGPGARLDPIGGWVALDVHGPDLAPLSPIPGGPAWYPRPHRALFFDRAGHRTPEVVIPYEVGP
jgi:DNA segregation ATPase FtsK/SpoIIIE, S-DNA-T family